VEIKVLASGSSGNSYMIDDGETKLLIEAGIRVKEIQKALNFDLQRVAGCLVTHQHL
jgi:phosphoribosyl 1,2-cyclic phosphodiesterase